MKKIITVIDTETATLNGEVFDFGMVITNRKGEVLDTYEAIVEEVYANQKVMQGAYYFSKVATFYRPNIRCSRMPVKSWATICKEVNTLMKKHGVNTIAAYNLAFDRRAIINTGRKYDGYMALKGREQLDLWRVSCETLLQQKTFKRLAARLGWVSKAGNVRTSAEVSYRYAFGEWDFKESHTALDDALIETQLVKRIFALKKRINYGIISHPWRLVQG